jgi:hypothetical protein
MTEIINAFHPKFIETYYPEKAKENRIYASKLASIAMATKKSQSSRESIKGKNVTSIEAFPKTKAKK